MYQLEWVILATDHYAQSREFYKDLLKLPVVRETSNEQFSQFKLKNCFLAIYGRKEIQKLVANIPQPAGGGAIYTFAQVADVDEEYRKLQKLGVKFSQSPQTQPWNQRTAYFSDPDGHVWEIQQWLNPKDGNT